uniref:Uncharacterized protein n=1 Tax=Rhizophora mucronata TaxID=61149 RepID=A0A2P2PDK6_RHIMU
MPKAQTSKECQKKITNCRKTFTVNTYSAE